MTSVTARERRYLFEPEPVPALPVRGSDKLFPVHRIYCVGRNYAEHAREMGHDPNREPPFFFQKNPDSLIPGNGDFEDSLGNGILDNWLTTGTGGYDFRLGVGQGVGVINAVPEPSTLGFVALALAAGIASRRRRTT